MTAPYTTQTISGFDASPPSDDGSIAASNEVEWQKHLDKIGTPCKDLSEDINTELLSAFGLIFGQNISVHSGNYTVLAADQGKFLSVTGTTTITLLAAATAGAGFPLAIINNGTGVVTVDGSGAETINGDLTITLNPGNSIILTCNASLWIGYVGLGDQSIKTVGVASAVNELTVTNSATGNAVDISATGDDTNIDMTLTPKGAGSVIISTTSDVTISGSAATTIEVSGLDGTYTGGYIVDCFILTAGPGGLSLEINGDATGTNYYTSRVEVDGISPAINTNTSALHGLLGPGVSYIISLKILQDATNGEALIIGEQAYTDTAPGGKHYLFNSKYTVTDNITSIALTAGPGDIDVGSYLRVRRIV